MKISWIDKKLIAGGAIPISVENLEALKSEGIAAIITLTEHPLTSQKALTLEVFRQFDMEILHVPVVDQTPPETSQVQTVQAFVKQMHAENRAVYIHCHAGVGRTGTMLHALYMMNGMSFEDTKQKIKTTRPASQFFMLSDSQKAFLEQLSQDLV